MKIEIVPKKDRPLSRIFQNNLVLVMTILFVISVICCVIVSTVFSRNRADDLLRLNIQDIKQDIADTSDRSMVNFAKQIVSAQKDMLERDDIDTVLSILSICDMIKESYSVSEVDIIDKNGIVIDSTNKSYIGFDMRNGEQSAEFLVLLNGIDKTYAQKYQPVAANKDISMKYVGIALERGGFIQIGYDYELIQKYVDAEVTDRTKNQHVGETGTIIICNDKLEIVSNSREYNNNEYDSADFKARAYGKEPYEMFETKVFGMDACCMYDYSEGYIILAVLPYEEVVNGGRLASIIVIGLIAVIALTLFYVIYILVKRIILNNLLLVNESLEKIASGDLNEVVDVRRTIEFITLSNDINATVNTLKRYIDEAEKRIDQELEFAKLVQSSALPSTFPAYPSRTDFDIFASMDPAKEVGGDFYDFELIDKDRMMILIADVSGKGIAAAMFMMTSKTMIKSMIKSGDDPATALTHANTELCVGNSAGMFVTVWLGVVDLMTGHVVYANAGHNRPLVKLQGGKYEFLKSPAGFVLAGMPGIQYKNQTIDLAHGDVIYLYTDGVTEATNISDELYGDDRLHERINSRDYSSMEELCEDISAGVAEFVKEADQFDDMTMLAFKYN